MAEVKKLNINDSTGAFKNINDLLEELRNNNVEALAIVYTRKSDQSTRTYRSGFNRVTLIGTLEQLKYDVLECDESHYIEYEKGLNDN